MFKPNSNIQMKTNEKYQISKLMSPINRPVSPIKNNRLEQHQKISRSPIRSRPSDLVVLKNYIDYNFLNKRQNNTPRKSKSPFRQHIKQQSQKNNALNKKSSVRNNVYHSPIKTRPFNEVFKTKISPNNLMETSNQKNIQLKEEQNEIYEKQNKKQNLQLFTQLLGKIKLKQTTNDYMKNLSTQTNRQQIRKPELRQFTSMLKNKELKSQIESYINTQTSKIQSKQSFKQNDKFSQDILNISLGKNSIIEPKQKQNKLLLAPQKIILPKQIKESADSLSKNDIVNESISFDSMNEHTLNMDPCF